MHKYKSFKVFFAICLCVLCNACVSYQAERLAGKDILELSETDFVIVVRSNSNSSFDEAELRRLAIEQVTEYSLSKGMIPHLMEESIESPSGDVAGYIKQKIRLLEWDVAQAKLNTTSELAASELSFDVQDSSDSLGTIANSEDVIFSNGSDDSNFVSEVPVSKCAELKQQFDIDTGRAMGDMCKGHSLGVEYYNRLIENGCQEFSDLLELAEIGVSDHCAH